MTFPELVLVSAHGTSSPGGVLGRHSPGPVIFHTDLMIFTLATALPTSSSSFRLLIF